MAASSTQRTLFDVHQCIPNWEYRGRLLQRLRVKVSERRQVVEDIEAAAEGGDHEIVLALLDHNVTNSDRRHTAFELRPMTAAVEREEQAELGAGKQELGIHRILGDREHRSILRKIGGD